MKVKVEFECEVFSTDNEWFFINDELQHTSLEYVNNLKVFNTETDGEI